MVGAAVVGAQDVVVGIGVVGGGAVVGGGVVVGALVVVVVGGGGGVVVGALVVVVVDVVEVVLLVVGGGGGGWSVHWEMKVFVQPSTGCQTGPGPSGGMQKQPLGQPFVSVQTRSQGLQSQTHEPLQGLRVVVVPMQGVFSRHPS